MLEVDLVSWLDSTLGCEVFYQHLHRQPVSPFVWFTRSGDSSADALDDSGDPDVVFCDLEIYSDDLAELQTICAALRAERDYRGDLGNGYVDDIAIVDQVDDYQLRASAESLPQFSTSFRLTITGYES